MGFSITDKTGNSLLNRNLEKANREYADALEKLSSGQIFTRGDPKPADRALAEKLEFRIRSLASSKRNINDAVSLLQTAESSMEEINNMITRMKEINIQGASTTLNDQERRFLFVEYEALHDEINRIAVTTKFNGIPLLNGQDPEAPSTLIFRVDEPYFRNDRWSDYEDVNAIKFDGFNSVVATTEALGIRSAARLLSDTNEIEGLKIEDVQEMMVPDDDEFFTTVYDQALNHLSTQRAIFGAMQARLQKAMEYADVYQENISAAKSKIADTDYAKEVSKLVESKILMNAATALLSQSNINSQMSLNLLSSVFK